MAQGFLTGVDIANRGLQHIGARRIITFQDATRNAVEANAIYDKIRRAELRRSVWTFATRRAVLRSIGVTGGNFVPAGYNPATAYIPGDIVYDTSLTYWICILANTGQTPADPIYWTPYFGAMFAGTWSASPTYYPGDLVVVSSVVYICALQNVNQTPPNATYWLPCHGSITTTNVAVTFSPGIYQNDFAPRAIYNLPRSYLRIAPQDAHTADNARLSVSAEMRYRDWEFENGYLITKDVSPILFRFVADVTNVVLMDDLFCEAVAARMGLELCEMLTQNRDKLGATREAYTAAIKLAKDINAIEMGSTENEENPDVEVAPVPANQPARGAQ